MPILRRYAASLVAACVVAAVTSTSASGATAVAVDPGSTAATSPDSTSVAVDGAGNAYFAWIRNSTRPNPDEAEAVFCRIPAGAGACQNLQTLPNFFGGTNMKFYGPNRVQVAVAPSGAVHVVTYGPPYGPGGLRIFTSNDAGQSFPSVASPANSANYYFQQLLVLPGGSLLALFSESVGAQVSVFSPSGGGPGDFATLGSIGGMYATVGRSGANLVSVSDHPGKPLDAFAYSGDFSDASINDSGNWSGVPISAASGEDRPRLTGAPGPVTLISYVTGGSNNVRIWNGSSFNAPVTAGNLGVFDDIAAATPQQIVAAGAGSTSLTSGLQLAISSNGGASFSAPFPIVASPPSGNIKYVRIAASGASGWAIFNSAGIIYAVPFSTIAPPPPAPPPPAPVTCGVPSLVGQPASAAPARLAASNCTLGPRIYSFPNARLDTVISTAPVAGAAQAAGTPVNLGVSLNGLTQLYRPIHVTHVKQRKHGKTRRVRKVSTGCIAPKRGFTFALLGSLALDHIAEANVTLGSHSLKSASGKLDGTQLSVPAVQKRLKRGASRFSLKLRLGLTNGQHVEYTKAYRVCKGHMRDKVAIDPGPILNPLAN